MKNNKNWAYGAFTINSDELGIGTIYYGAEYFEVDDNEPIRIFNPNTNAVYTDDEIKTIVNGAVDGNDGYIMNIPDNVAIGISTNNSDRIFWYDQDATKAVLSHTDALILDRETGVLKTTDNITVAEAIK